MNLSIRGGYGDAATTTFYGGTGTIQFTLKYSSIKSCTKISETGAELGLDGMILGANLVSVAL